MRDDTMWEAALRAQAGMHCRDIHIFETACWRWECQCGENGAALKRSDVLRGALAHVEAEEAS